MHLHTLVAFEDELQKLAKSDEDLGFFERHPKKILGGTLAALGTGAYLLSRGKKGGSAITHSAPAKQLTHAEALAAGHPGAKPLPSPKAHKPEKKVEHAPAKKAESPVAPKAEPAPQVEKPPAKKLTHEEAKKLGYPGAGPKTTANQAQKHLGEEAIQAAREHGMRAGMSTDEHRAVTHANDVAKWLRKHKKSTT
jgi:hypothetical protein